MLFDVSGSRKSNMAVVKSEIHVSQLIYIVESTFDPNAITMFSRMPNSIVVLVRKMLPAVNGSRKPKKAIVKPEIHVSQLVDKIQSKFQRQQLCFRAYGTKLRYMYFRLNNRHFTFQNSA